MMKYVNHGRFFIFYKKFNVQKHIADFKFFDCLLAAPP